MDTMNEESQSLKNRHPIQVVARRTGLTPDVLRVWERRYSVVEPERSESGRRLYSDADVAKLSMLSRAVSAGRRISRVSKLSEPELVRLVEEDDAAAIRARETTRVSLEGDPSAHYEQALDAVQHFDARKLEATLMRAAIALSASTLIDDVAAPLMQEIGARWHNGQLSPAHEHLASAVLRNVLERLTSACDPSPGAPVLVVGTPANQVHEFGALFVAVAAASEGWRVIYLAPNLPAADLARCAAEAEADAVALSLVFPDDDPAVSEELALLRDSVGSRLPILVGGRASHAYAEAIGAIGGTIIGDLAGLRSSLQEVAATA